MEANKLKVEMVAISQLIPYVRNAREHSDTQIAQIASSIREFGFTNPVLTDGNKGIIAGHGRVLAARKLEMDMVPCINLPDLSEHQKRAYVLADNKLAMNAEWDYSALSIELGDLSAADFDTELTGFSAMEIASILNLETIDNLDGEWEGMPEYESENQQAYRTIAVHFLDTDAVSDFAEIVGQQITEKTKYIYHPAQVRDNLKSTAYVESEDEL